MNERIRLLAEQAGLKYHNWITNESNVKDGDFRYPRLEDLENFAELIVRECISKCESIADMATITNRGEMARKTKATADCCATMIKQHFGVEE